MKLLIMQYPEPPVSSSLLRQNILFSTLLTNTLSHSIPSTLEAMFHILTKPQAKWVLDVLTLTSFRERQEKSF
jgi:hypothetical protein